MCRWSGCSGYCVLILAVLRDVKLVIAMHIFSVSFVCLSRVYPVVIRSDEVWTFCHILLFLSNILDDHILLSYSSVVLVMVVYGFVNFSYGLPQCEVVGS